VQGYAEGEGDGDAAGIDREDEVGVILDFY